MTHKNHSRLAKLTDTLRMPVSTTEQSIFDFFSSLNCSKSLAAWILYSNKEYQQLLDLEARPLDYNDPFEFRDAYASVCFLSKADFLNLEVPRKEVAFKKFFEFEELCKDTNNRFSYPSLDPLYKGENVWLHNAIKRKIETILGGYLGEEFVDQANWGPGVTTMLKGSEVSAFNKFQSETGITRNLYSLVSPWFSTAYPLWNLSRTRNCETAFTPVVGNSIVTVPKNSKTDRVIAVEPGINLWFQKGIGSMIRRRLQRVGVDLTSQTRNQQLACEGSFDNSLATVDFSSASDSISRRLVEELLPPRWYLLLNATRSTLGIHNDKIIRWEKFSSMGNGFTFELESLIFYAAALSCCDYLGVSSEKVSVFGDDVIIPSECYELFSSFSLYLGFRVNPKKSFSSTAFRESCGSHYFEGVDVKPIYLKGKISHVQDVYKLANNIRNLANRRNSYYGCDARFHRCWRHLVSRVPNSIRFRTSRSQGDTGFASNFDEAVPVRAKHGIEGFLALSRLELGVTRETDDLALLLARLKVPSPQAYKNTYTLRGRTRTKVAFVLVPRWYNYGPWF